MTGKHRLALALALVASTAWAQQGPPSGGRPAREEAFRMVDAYVVSNLQESLALTDEQFAKAIPLVKKLQSERRDYLFERMRLVREMRHLLQQGGAVEPQVLELLKEAKKLETEGPERIRRDFEALDALLTPIQQAKFRVLEGEVERRVRELTNRARGMRPGAPPMNEPQPQPQQQ